MVKAWFKVHAKQLVTLGLWLAAMVAIHYRPTMRDEFVAGASALFFVGIQLPPFTLKGGAQVASKLVGGALVVLVALACFVGACTKQTFAKDEYTAGLKACDDKSATRADDDACKATWRAKWDEAGAPPAATTDGGGQ